MMHACIECIINERHSTRGGGTRVSAACASIPHYALARPMTREGWNESKGDKRVYIDASKGDGEPTNMAIIQKCEGERTEERKRVVKSVAS